MRQLCQAASGSVRLSVMKQKLRQAFNNSALPGVLQMSSVGAHRGWSPVRAEAGSLTQRAAVAKQTAQVNRVTVAAVRSAWAAVLSGAASSYILGLKLQFK